MLREHKSYGNWLRFYDIESSGTVTLTYSDESGGSYIDGTKVEYSYDGFEWSDYRCDTQLSLDPSQVLYFRAATDNTVFCSDPGEQRPFGHFDVSKQCKCGGDVMSLLEKNGLAFTAYSYIFKGMFKGTKITTAPEISATVLETACFYEMFEDCGSLVEPMLSLPAEELAQQSYYGMFRNCTSLSRTPDLAFAEVAYQSCYRMFYGCESIESVFLRPIELSVESFKEMFMNCTSLNYIRCRFITWPEYRGNYYTQDDDVRRDATFDWTRNVALTGTFVRDSRLPLYINDTATSGTDTYSGTVYNWDPHHGTNGEVYNTTNMYHFDPWVNKESVNLTEYPPACVVYETIANDKEGFTATFQFLSTMAVAKENTGEPAALIESDDDSFRKVLDDQEVPSNHYYDAGHMGQLDITQLFMETFNCSEEDTMLTPDHEVYIDWGDGTIIEIPKVTRVDANRVFPSENPQVPSVIDGKIGGIYRHTYAPGGPYTIRVYSKNLSVDDTFFAKELVNYGGGVIRYEFKGCMVPLYAGADSNIAAILTPLLPMYAGYRTHGKYYPIPCLFRGNKTLESVPSDPSAGDSFESPYGFIFAKCKNNLDHPFSAARMFENCDKLKAAPNLCVFNINQYDPYGQNAVSLAAPVVQNSSFEGFMCGCRKAEKAVIPDIAMKPFLFAEAFRNCIAMKRIECQFDDWYSDYEYLDPSATNLASTWHWTKDIFDEYGSGGTFVNPNASVVTRTSTSPDDHEYNPWNIPDPEDDDMLTFTNNSNTAKTVTLKNHRKLYASLVNGERRLDLNVGTQETQTVKCHVHLLKYRKKLSGGTWQQQWYEITDDPTDKSGTTIHSTTEPSTLTSETGFDFVWQITLDPGEAVQVIGVPCSYGDVHWQTFNGTTYPCPTYVPVWSNSKYTNSLYFDQTDYYSAGGDAAYWFECPTYNFNGTVRPATVINQNGSYTIGPLYSAAEYTSFQDNVIHSGNIMTGPYYIWKGQRMQTGVNTPTMYYQFYGCDGLEVSGFIDTFFDHLDYKSKAFAAPPYAYYRLFKDTGITTPPKVAAYQGTDRAEFCECFMGCTNLQTLCLMNTSPYNMPSPSERPAKTLRYNYNTMCFVPFSAINGPAGIDYESILTDGGLTSALGTTYWDNIGYGECMYGNNVHPGAFERMYKGCTSLQWPVSQTGNPKQLSVIHMKSSGRTYSRGRTFRSMFEGCTSIGTFGLVVYGKSDDSGNQDKPSNLKYHALEDMFKNCTTGDNYLWNCFYTVASLKHYTKYGNRDGVLASWEAGGPTWKWLDNTNVALIYTNCADRKNSHDQDPWEVATAGAMIGESYCGTCSHNAWTAARNAHYNDYQAAIPGANHNKPWVRFNKTSFINNELLTWVPNTTLEVEEL